jgi:hypothetical protein
LLSTTTWGSGGIMQKLLAAAHNIIEVKQLLRPLLLGGNQAREALGVDD